MDKGELVLIASFPKSGGSWLVWMLMDLIHKPDYYCDLVDKKILAGGIAMIAVGIAFSAMLTDMTPIGREGMTDEEIAEFLLEERENEDFTTLAGILVGIGFLLVLISFGARRKRKGGAKKTEKKPATK